MNLLKLVKIFYLSAPIFPANQKFSQWIESLLQQILILLPSISEECAERFFFSSATYVVRKKLCPLLFSFLSLPQWVHIDAFVKKDLAIVYLRIMLRATKKQQLSEMKDREWVEESRWLGEIKELLAQGLV